MNTRTTALRRNFRTGFKTKNNSTSFRTIPRRYYSTRPNRRYPPKVSRNRLERVQNIIGFNKKYQQPRPKTYYSNFISNRNNNVTNKREVYIKGLPRYVTNTGLFNLFKNEGRIIHYRILYDNVGFSRGIGKIVFANFRDALNVINKWNNSTYKGFTLKVEYKKMKNGKTENGNNTPAQFGDNKIYTNSPNYQNYSRKFYGNGYNKYNYRY